MSMLSDYQRLVEAPMVRSYEATIKELRARVAELEAAKSPEPSFAEVKAAYEATGAGQRFEPWAAEWFRKRAVLEGDHEVGAGLGKSPDPRPLGEEVAGSIGRMFKRAKHAPTAPLTGEEVAGLVAEERKIPWEVRDANLATLRENALRASTRNTEAGDKWTRSHGCVIGAGYTIAFPARGNYCVAPHKPNPENEANYARHSSGANPFQIVAMVDEIRNLREAISTLSAERDAMERDAYKRGWNDREGDFLVAMDRIYPVAGPPRIGLREALEGCVAFMEEVQDQGYGGMSSYDVPYVNAKFALQQGGETDEQG